MLDWGLLNKHNIESENALVFKLTKRQRTVGSPNILKSRVNKTRTSPTEPTRDAESLESAVRISQKRTYRSVINSDIS